MTMITTVRVAVPVSDIQPAAQDHHSGRQAAKTAGPGTDPEPATSHLAAKQPGLDPRLLQAPCLAETSATAAAEAAREAYIRASIAAGISPLPLA